MRTLRLLLLALVGTPALVHADVLFSQPPADGDGFYLYGSQTTGDSNPQYADDFTFEGPATINSVTWWGTDTSSQFVVRFYTGTESAVPHNIPSSDLDIFTVSPTKTDTHRLNEDGDEIYEFTAPVSQFIPDPADYWVSILPTGGSWGWQTTDVDAVDVYLEPVASTGPRQQGFSSTGEGSMAFQLDGNPGPAVPLPAAAPAGAALLAALVARRRLRRSR